MRRILLLLCVGLLACGSDDTSDPDAATGGDDAATEEDARTDDADPESGTVRRPMVPCSVAPLSAKADRSVAPARARPPAWRPERVRCEIPVAKVGAAFRDPVALRAAKDPVCVPERVSGVNPTRKTVDDDPPTFACPHPGIPLRCVRRQPAPARHRCHVHGGGAVPSRSLPRRRRLRHRGGVLRRCDRAARVPQLLPWTTVIAHRIRTPRGNLR
jgi:hypothetical protein